MKLGMQVGLGPGHIVLNWDPAPLPKEGRSPQFSAHICCGQMHGCIDQDATWYAAMTRPRRLCVRWRPSSPPQFSAHVHCGQTADSCQSLRLHIFPGLRNVQNFYRLYLRFTSGFHQNYLLFKGYKASYNRKCPTLPVQFLNSQPQPLKLGGGSAPF